jgi:N-6 DNA Methylase
LVAVLRGERIAQSEIAAVRPLGASLVFGCLPDHYDLWKQGAMRPEFHLRLEPQELPRFFERHVSNLAPESIYRAKVWGRLDHTFQLDFVDAGFLPMVEDEAGRKLTDLVERVVSDTKRRLGWRDVSASDGRWLLQSTFWLLAAKILKDKAVPGFVRLDLSDLEDVYLRLARHYDRDHPRPVQVRGGHSRSALVSAAEQIKSFAHCGAVSTEALAHLYESALIDRAVRQKLGTHSTPTWLVDYIVGRLRPWVERDIAVEERRVFEPACGHAGFLIAAMRLLSELLPSSWYQSRRAYLRERLYGIEVDSLAVEIARLSLTLADVPNPNGWALKEADMFTAGLLEDGVRGATIALGNPPFESFSPNDRGVGCLPNRAAETFRRVVENLPPAGVFGFVLPRTFLRAKQATEVRRTLLRDYEIAEISVFADKVFRYGEPESCVLIGRRLTRRPTNGLTIHYRRIREGQIEEFSRTYEAGSNFSVPQERLAHTEGSSLLIPDLDDVWQSLAELPAFRQFADIGKGFDHKGDDDPSLPANFIKIGKPSDKGLDPGFAGWREDQMTHRLPELVGLNLGPKGMGSERRGTTSGIPQVLLNYAPVAREAWRLKALIDEEGHPVTSRFIVVRPKGGTISLLVLWAICNSPIGNAYAYCMSSKREILTGDLERMPVPHLGRENLRSLERAVKEYLDKAQAATHDLNTQARGKRRSVDPRQMTLEASNGAPKNDAATDHEKEHLKFLHWRVDAEVLRLYDLPTELERKILDLFRGLIRRGVPFDQDKYFRRDVTDLNRLADLLAITADWQKTNRRRAKLMDLDEDGALTTSESGELRNLQRLADARVSLIKSGSTDEIDRAIESLKRRGLWKE